MISVQLISFPCLSPPLPTTPQCIIYKLVRSSRLQMLLENEEIQSSLEAQHASNYVDTDGLFDESRNCDYSHAAGGITRERFTTCFLPFICVCVEQVEGLEVREEGEGGGLGGRRGGRGEGSGGEGRGRGQGIGRRERGEGRREWR